MTIAVEWDVKPLTNQLSKSFEPCIFTLAIPIHSLPLLSAPLVPDFHIWAVTRDFQKCGILTSVDSDEPVAETSPFKLRNLKWGSVSILIVIEFLSDKQRLWSVCVYAKAGLSHSWSHIPHFWKSHAMAHFVGRQVKKLLLLLNVVSRIFWGMR